MRYKRDGIDFLDPYVQGYVNRFCRGNGVDVGCGWRKLGGGCLGIDKIGYGKLTNDDPEDPHYSQADWRCDVKDIPIKDDSMDFVFGHHVLEHIKGIYQALQEWVRILKPGGYLVLITPDVNYCTSPTARKRGYVLYHGLEPKDVKDLIDLLPLEVISFNSMKDRNVFECIARKIVKPPDDEEPPGPPYKCEGGGTYVWGTDSCW